MFQNQHSPYLILCMIGVLILVSCNVHQLEDTWIRPQDEMVMVYVPPGDFQMGSSKDKVFAAKDLCKSSYKGISDPHHNDGFPDTAPVGSFPDGKSWVGALDLVGNVRE